MTISRYFEQRVCLFQRLAKLKLNVYDILQE